MTWWLAVLRVLLPSAAAPQPWLAAHGIVLCQCRVLGQERCRDTSKRASEGVPGHSSNMPHRMFTRISKWQKPERGQQTGGPTFEATHRGLWNRSDAACSAPWLDWL